MSNSDWWAKQLGTQPQTPAPRPAAMPMPPSQMPMAPMPQIQKPVTTRAQSAAQTQTCPECGSNNYLSVQGAKPRCIDCGYPVEQSGSRYGALNGARVEGNAKSALGNTQGGWTPMPAGYNADGTKQG
jgi:ribosomal protein L37E